MSAEPQSIELVIAQTPTIALLDPAKKEELYAFLRNEIATFAPDLSTDQGRKKVASLAYKIARTKTAIDEAGLALNKKHRDEMSEIDNARKEIREKLDALKEEARRPLTEWETTEDARLKLVKETFDYFRDVTIISVDTTSGIVESFLREVRAREIKESDFRELLAAAEGAKAHAISSLRASLERIQEAEFDREELLRLRKESEERAEKDRIAAETAELAARMQEKKEREAQRVREMEEARANADREREAREKEIAALAAKRAEERVALELEDKHRHELAIERQRAEDAERKQREEAQRLEMAEVSKRVEAARKAEEERKLAANKKHRVKIIGEAQAAIREFLDAADFDPEVSIVAAIVSGEIPHVSISFTGEAK